MKGETFDNFLGMPLMYYVPEFDLNKLYVHDMTMQDPCYLEFQLNFSY